MAKNQSESTSQPEGVNTPDGNVDEKVTLTEFCMRLSKNDRRVELIGGFNASETAAGHVKDTEAKFNARYSAFINKPV